MKDIFQQADEASQLLKLISHPHRLMILCALLDQPYNVSSLTELVGISQTAMSNHLAKLRSERLVEFTREHRTLTYRLSNSKVEVIIQALHKIYCAK